MIYVKSSNSYLAVDLTASKNIDANQGNLDIFCIQASSIERIFELLHKTYGGEWNLVVPSWEERIMLFMKKVRDLV